MLHAADDDDDDHDAERCTQYSTSVVQRRFLLCMRSRVTDARNGAPVLPEVVRRSPKDYTSPLFSSEQTSGTEQVRSFRSGSNSFRTAVGRFKSKPNAHTIPIRALLVEFNRYVS